MFGAEVILSRLNEPQQEAVTHGEGPLLILAGAGSGKTRVITHRIAHLVSAAGVDPREIVAVTFTNKAAGEMRERVERLIGFEFAGAYVGTFHAFGLRLLRHHAAEAGYPSSFVIYDTTDQRAVVRQVLKEAAVDERQFTPPSVLSWISRTKTLLIDPDEAEARSRLPHERTLASCYREFESRLRRAGAMDFDDLLVKLIRLFERREDLAERYARRIRWLLVDEYQDTNALQYRLIRLLTAEYRNLCCVGDEDQSIYAFRGADIRNILDFQRDFPDAHIVKLEQNYRSTRTVLGAAHAVISHNTDRHDKKLWTENEAGEPVRVEIVVDERLEADFVVGELMRRAQCGLRLDQMAILYRTNASSRLFEDRLMRHNLPYRIIGSVRFYERKEIKDLIAWLRLMVHPESDQDFLRAVTAPPQGIGAKTIEVIANRAEQDRSGLLAAARELLAESPAGALSSRAAKAVRSFSDRLEALAHQCGSVSTVELIRALIETIDYAAYLARAYPSDPGSRAENLDAFVSAAREHDDAGAADGLAGFLDRISLRADTDDVRGEQGPSLMTAHSAKGLEFDGVFIVGLNEEQFPHVRALEDARGLEEERRLMYVAMTRARRFLVLTATQKRLQFGEEILAQASRFLDEIPAELTSGSRRLLSLDRGARASRAHGSAHGKHDGESRTPAAGTVSVSGNLRYVPDEDHAFAPGMRVGHPDFGEGTILRVSGDVTRVVLDIRFDNAGRRRILPEKVPLSFV
ncbi:MAG: UvrD-helicase domain-containing protein [Acidobacteriota bacterium]|nr:MAG: UvrD-helicase domain-containing protein [Acidobacteriota bacterium]